LILHEFNILELQVDFVGTVKTRNPMICCNCFLESFSPNKIK